MNKNEHFKSGFVAVVGRPNVGKSTLINALIGDKIAIVSDKAQTTRNRIICVYTDEAKQIVFMDTPGVHKPKHKLGEFMVDAAIESLKETEAVLFVVAGNECIRRNITGRSTILPRGYDYGPTRTSYHF